jgi:PAS domain S-box-containing protein
MTDDAHGNEERRSDDDLGAEPAGLHESVDEPLDESRSESADLRETLDDLAAAEGERSHADEALRQSEERYRRLVEGLPDIVWSMSDKRGLLYVSPRAEEVLGFTRQELYERPWFWTERMHPEDRKRAFEALARSTAGAELDMEYRIQDRSGRWHLFHDRAIGRRTRGDETIVEGIATDITEQRRAEEALQSSELLYRATIDAMADVIHMVDRDLTITLANETLRRYATEFGVSNDLVGQNIFDVCPFLNDKIREEYRRVFESGEAMMTEEENEVAGRTVITETRKIPILEDGKVVRVITVVRDVSERAKAEDVQSVLFQISQAVSDTADLQELIGVVHRELGRLVDTTNFYVALYDEETELYTFPYHVDKYDSDEIGAVPLRKSLTDYVRRTGEALMVDPQEHAALIQQGEVELIGAQSTIWLGVPLKAGGKIIGVVVVQCYDEAQLYTAEDRELLAFVSESIGVAIERKKAEEERREFETQIQLAQKLESLGVLAGGIAHDFNNLLTGILGNADLAMMEIGPDTSVAGHLKEIKTTAERAADLSRQMLAYSGRGSFVIEPIALNSLVTEMVHLLEVSISKKVVMRYDLDDALPEMVGDVTQIRQVIMNLITNASDAIGDEEGLITISTGWMNCERADFAGVYLDDQLEEGAYVYLEVADTGCGMDDETRRRVFDPFFTTKFTGRGLGLASALGIIRGHKGAVRVDSKVGKGTRFRVLFPAGGEPAAKPVSEELPEVEWDGGGTVLVVDDEEAIREVGTLMLEQAGFGVITACDGAEAVGVYRDRADEIACVLLDLTMPRLGGEETYRELKQIRDDVCVVLSSGYSELEVGERFEGQGIAGFVQKPYLAVELVARVREAIGRVDESGPAGTV